MKGDLASHRKPARGQLVTYIVWCCTAENSIAKTIQKRRRKLQAFRKGIGDAVRFLIVTKSKAEKTKKVRGGIY